MSVHSAQADVTLQLLLLMMLLLHHNDARPSSNCRPVDDQLHLVLPTNTAAVQQPRMRQLQHLHVLETDDDDGATSKTATIQQVPRCSRLP